MREAAQGNVAFILDGTMRPNVQVKCHSLILEARNKYQFAFHNYDAAVGVDSLTEAGFT